MFNLQNDAARFADNTVGSMDDLQQSVIHICLVLKFAKKTELREERKKIFMKMALTP
jgi:hypothetical protein